MDSGVCEMSDAVASLHLLLHGQITQIGRMEALRDVEQIFT